MLQLDTLFNQCNIKSSYDLLSFILYEELTERQKKQPRMHLNEIHIGILKPSNEKYIEISRVKGKQFVK